MSVREIFGKETEVKQCEIANVFVAIPTKGRRHFVTGMREHFKHILQAAARFIFDAIHIFDLHELGQKICDVLDRVRIVQIQMPHSTLG